MSGKKSFRIAVLPGDGIGPEVMQEAVRVLGVIQKKYGFDCDMVYGLIGGAAIDGCGTPLPEETRQICRNSDAVLLGCVGGPKWDALPLERRPESGGLLVLRREMELYANIRPLVLFKELRDISPLSSSKTEKEIDLVVVRELAGGIYFGKPRRLGADEGLDTMLYRRRDVERIAEVAFSLAGRRRGRITSVDKANVLSSSVLWRSVVDEIAAQHPEIEVRHMYVDNAAMQLILNPHQFDVILTTNLFGDILSDETAAIGGSLGMLPSASLGKKSHLYEPAGGSAPDIAGTGAANPVAMILSMALMLEYTFDRTDAAKDVFMAVGTAVKDGYRTRDVCSDAKHSVSTEEMGRAVCRYL